MSDGVDVAVVGGGPAGAVAALVCARAGLRVTLFDDGGRALPSVGESLPAAAGPMLHKLGLGDALDGHLACYGNTFAWGSPELETMDAVRDPHGHGWHLDRRRYDRFLRERALATGVHGVQARVTAARELDDGIVLTAGGTRVFARWLVDASGRRSAVARRLGAVRKRDDDLVALCSWATMPAGTPDGRTLIETCPAGWWYSAALPDGTRSVVLHTDGDVAGRLSDPNRWHALLSCTRHVRAVVAEATAMTPPRGAEAAGAWLAPPRGSRWIAVGDAACSFDPVSSQGIFFAVYSGMRGAQALVAAGVGDADALDRYVSRVTSVRAAYLARHRFVYAVERRWAAAPFWQRRATMAERAPDRSRARSAAATRHDDRGPGLSGATWPALGPARWQGRVPSRP